MEEKIKHLNLDEKVYEKIKKMIVDKRLKSGKKIVQDELAHRLGVSRTPIRRALTQLAKENLVKIVPRKGTYVKDFTLEEMILIFEMREILEGFACRKAASLITRKQVVTFRNLYKKAIKAADASHWVSYTKTDERFHTFITEICQIELLQEIIQAFHILSVSYTGGLIRPPQETFPEHMAILDALENHGGEKAESLMRQHTRKSIEVLKMKLLQERRKREE